MKLFYSFVFENGDKLKPQHISLYMFMLNQNNRNNWVEWFKMPLDLAMAGSCIGSKKTYYKCLDDLQDLNLITYKKGVNEWKAPIVRIEVIKCTSTIPQSEPLPIPQGTTQPIPLPIPQGTQSIYNLKPITINLKQVTEICDLFAFTEMSNFVSYKLVFEFIEMLEHSEKINQFTEYFEGYKIWRQKTEPRYRHSLEKFLGTIENRFVDGKWNDAKYLLELPPKPEKKIINPAHYNKYEVYVFKCKNFSTEPPISETEWRLAQPE